MLTRLSPSIAAAALLCAACDFNNSGGSRAELRLAVDESVATGQAEAVQQDIVEISTSFTLGGAVDDAIAGIKAFIAAEAPCTTVTKAGDHGLTIDFGTLADECEYKGRHYAGTLTITVDVTDATTVVHHTAAAFSNGAITLDGTADVTWTTASRQVVSDLQFVRDGRETTVQGDRTMHLLDSAAGLSGGITVDGTRAWQTDKGDFSLTIEAVELRPADPIPQAGTYTLTVPSGAVVTMTFTRIDGDTIEVRIAGPRRDTVFRVTSTGAVDEASA